jgi:hypothetical protein
MKSGSSLLPEHEALRRAVAWLAERGPWTPELVDEAARRFDLSPADEAFLLRECDRAGEEARGRRRTP